MQQAFHPSATHEIPPRTTCALRHMPGSLTQPCIAASLPALPCPALHPPFPLQAGQGDVAISQAEAFTLHSRPGALRKLFLDFDGHTTVGAQWNYQYTANAPIVTPAYDTVSHTCIPAAADAVSTTAALLQHGYTVR